MDTKTWKPTPDSFRVLNQMSILYGDMHGGVLAEHAHVDTQVSIHFARQSSLAANPLHVHVYPSGYPHSGSWKPGNEVIVFLLAPGLLAETREEFTGRAERQVLPALSARDRVLEALGLMARDEFVISYPFDSLYAESLGHVMARHLLRKHASADIVAPRRCTITPDELRNLNAFVHDNLQRGFSVRELAAAIGVGPAKLSQKLREARRQSPWQFVQEQRIQHAKSMLRNQRTSLADMAARLGFVDQSHFTNAFRRATGTTPKTYRRGL